MVRASQLMVLLVFVNCSIEDDKKNNTLRRGIKDSNVVKRQVIFPSEPASQSGCDDLPDSTCQNVRSCPNRRTELKEMKICGWSDYQPMVCCAKKVDLDKTSGKLQSNIECGVLNRVSTETTSRISKRQIERQVQLESPSIVGGTRVRDLAYPWMGALEKRTYGTNHRLMCGSSLISPKHLLTAAHCFQEGDDKTPEKFSVMLGSHRLNNGTRFSIQTITIHPDYNFKENYNDIAVLTLTEEIPRIRTMSPICLPEAEIGQREDLTGLEALVIGWGNTAYGGINSPDLLEVKVPIVSTTDCNSAYLTVARKTFPRGITDDFLCAGVEEGGKDSCQNDSGGPMQIEDTNSWVQLGIVSFGFGCAVPNFPGVYTRVGPYVPWINEVMEKTLG